MGAQGKRLLSQKRVRIGGSAVVAVLLLSGIVAGCSDDEPATAASTITTASTITAATTAAPSTTTAPVVTESITGPAAGALAFLFTATEDTYVNIEKPMEAHGDQDTLKIEDDAPERQHALVRFQVTGIPEGKDVTRAVLRLLVVKDAESPVTVSLVDGAWSQVATTWQTAPAIGAEVTVIEPGDPDGAIVEVDVTGVVNGVGQVDFYLTPTAGDTVKYASIESGDGPTLLVTWGDDG